MDKRVDKAQGTTGKRWQKANERRRLYLFAHHCISVKETKEEYLRLLQCTDTELLKDREAEKLFAEARILMDLHNVHFNHSTRIVRTLIRILYGRMISMPRIVYVKVLHGIVEAQERCTETECYHSRMGAESICTKRCNCFLRGCVYKKHLEILRLLADASKRLLQNKEMKQKDFTGTLADKRSEQVRAIVDKIISHVFCT